MQNTYIDALAQLARMEGYEIRFTDIRPGFVATPLLAKDGDYPMLMNTEKVARKIMQVLRKPRRRVVIDRRYAWLVFGWKLIPQGLWERLKIRKKSNGNGPEGTRKKNRTLVRHVAPQGGAGDRGTFLLRIVSIPRVGDRNTGEAKPSNTGFGSGTPEAGSLPGRSGATPTPKNGVMSNGSSRTAWITDGRSVSTASRSSSGKTVG